MHLDANDLGKSLAEASPAGLKRAKRRFKVSKRSVSNGKAAPHDL
jgi:hypothetical protein